MSQSPAPHAVRQTAAAQADPDVIAFELPPELLARLDEARGRLSRSDAVATVIVGLLRGTAEIVSTNKKPTPAAQAAAPTTPPQEAEEPTAPARSAKPVADLEAGVTGGRRPDPSEPASERPSVSRVAEAEPPRAAEPVASERQEADSPGGAGSGASELDFAHEYFRMMDGSVDAPSLVVSRQKPMPRAPRKRAAARNGSTRGSGATAGEDQTRPGAGRQRKSAGRLIDAAAMGKRLAIDRRTLTTVGGLVLLGGGLLGSAVLNLQLIDQNETVESVSQQVLADRDALRRQVESSTAQSRDLMEKVELLERSLQTARADLRLLRGSRGDIAASLPPTPGAAPAPESSGNAGSPGPTTIPDDRPAANESVQPGRTDDTGVAAGQDRPLFRIEGMPRTEPAPGSDSQSLSAAPASRSATVQPAPPAPLESRPQAAALPADQQSAPAAQAEALPAAPRPKPPVPESFQGPAPQEAAAAPSRQAGASGNAAGGIVIQGLPLSAAPQYAAPNAGTGRVPQQVPQLVPRAVPVTQDRAAAGATNGSTVIYGQPAPSVATGQVPGMQNAVPAPPPTPRTAPPAVTPQQMRSGVPAPRSQAGSPGGSAQTGTGGLASPGTAIGGADWSRFEMMADPAFGLRGQKNTQ